MDLRRVVRSNGDVEHDWELTQGLQRGPILKKGDYIKHPSWALYHHWQSGGMYRSTEELNAHKRSEG